MDNRSRRSSEKTQNPPESCGEHGTYHKYKCCNLFHTLPRNAAALVLTTASVWSLTKSVFPTWHREEELPEHLDIRWHSIRDAEDIDIHAANVWHLLLFVEIKGLSDESFSSAPSLLWTSSPVKFHQQIYLQAESVGKGQNVGIW